MKGLLGWNGVALTMLLISPLLALAQEPYRLLHYGQITVVSLEGPAATSGSGPGSDGLVVGYAQNYAATLTTDGHLVVNGDYYGRVPTDDAASVVVTAGRVFVDGVRRVSQPLPDDLAARVFGEPDSAEVDWTPILGWPVKAKVYIRDARKEPMAGGRRAAGIGPYVLGMSKDRAFFVWGIPYGQIEDGDTVEVYRDRVLVNGKVRPPTLTPPPPK